MNKYEKFPAYFRGLLEDKTVVFSEDTLFEYKPIFCYRAVERSIEDNSEVSMKDFQSYYDKGIKVTKGKIIDTTDADYYSISLSLTKERLERLFKFPNPNKKMIKGYVYEEGGPEETRKDGHVSWWLYEDTKVNGFSLL